MGNIKKKDLKKQSSVLIACVTCMLLIMVFCYFGIMNTKVTYSAYSCPQGGVLSGSKCIKTSCNPVSQGCPCGSGCSTIDGEYCCSTSYSATYTPDKVTYTATFNVNGGSGSTTTRSCSTTSGYCSITNVPSSAGTKEGYTFAGWGSSPSCVAGTYSGIQISTNTYFYACWKPVVIESKQVVASFNVDGGDAAIANKTCIIEGDHTKCSITLPSSAGTKEGYKFAGWGTSKGCTAGSSGGSTVSIGTDTKYYACWVADDNKCYKCINKNTSSVCQSGYGVNYVWSSAPTSGEYCTVQSSFTSKSACEGNSNVTCLAKCSDGYEMNNKGECVKNDEYCYKCVRKNDSSSCLSGYGYYHVWGSKLNDDEYCTRQSNYTTESACNGAGSASCLAACEDGYVMNYLGKCVEWVENGPKTFTYSFNANGGSVTPEPNTCKTTTDKPNTCNATLPASAGTRDGYTFKGWATNSTCTVGNTGTVSIAGNTQFFACWQKNDTSWGNNMCVCEKTSQGAVQYSCDTVKKASQDGSYSSFKEMCTNYCNQHHFSGSYITHTCTGTIGGGTDPAPGSSSSKPSSSSSNPSSSSKPSSSSSNPSSSSKPGSSSSTPSSSVPSSSNPSSSSSNVTENPKTGSIAIFMVWIMALGTVVYSVWYFRRMNENK